LNVFHRGVTLLRAQDRIRSGALQGGIFATTPG
jgi:hypothetical protein